MESVFKSREIVALLRKGDDDDEKMDGQDGACAIGKNCDVSYVIFLEPSSSNETASWGEWMVEKAIETFSPYPILAHCELVVPPIPNSSGGRVHFGTYLGCEGADWQNCRSKEEGIDFYLLQNGSRWRALPVFGKAAASNVREAAQANIHAPYSLAMYPTSAKPLRAFANLWSDQPGHKGHCAILSARVLKTAGLGDLVHSSAWYSPSSLYNELTEKVQTPLDKDELLEELSSVDEETCQETISSILHKPLSYSLVRDLGDQKCVDAIRVLTRRVCMSAGDTEKARQEQRELASVLLKWSLLRQEDEGVVV